MSSPFIDPFHPAAIFIQQKLGQGFLASFQLIMPPGAVINYSLAPPSNYVWLVIVQSVGPPRDIVTNNPLISPLITFYARHSMLVSQTSTIGLESFWRSPWSSILNLRVNDPLISTITNGTGNVILIDMTLMFVQITEDKYERYMRLWNGLGNLELLLGGINEDDVANLVNVLKVLGSPVTALEAIPEEKESTATLVEDVNGIRRIKIP